MNRPDRDSTSFIDATLGASPVISESELHAARVTVAGHARDGDDLRHLLSVLGIGRDGPILDHVATS